MADHTTFKTGGPADLWIRPLGECFPEYAAVLLESANNEGIPVFILGGGANLAVSDEGIRGIVLDTTGYTGTVPDNEKDFLHIPHSPRLRSSVPLYDDLGDISPSLFFRAGTSVENAVEITAAQGLSGLEFLAGMPGSIGGALWMNARCYDREMASVVRQVRVLERGVVRTVISKKEDYSYKKSPFQGKDCLILAVSVALEEGETSVIRETMTARRKDREAKGHYRYPSAGSAFKNNRAFGKPTGQIIDELGLKGLCVGDAQVAPWHGNIIINRGSARSSDILALVRMVEDRVRKETGLELEREILFTGNFL
jgi:UDP-N-acetylmuramate dehydrogenase